MSVKERIIKYLEFKGINKSEFGRTIGVSSAYISSMVKSIQPDKLKRITLNYPDLNTSWLITGEGEMLNSIDDSAPAPIPLSPAPTLSTESLLRIVESQQRTIENLSRIIENMSGKE